MPFRKGQSGNPGGRPKALAEIQALAREFAPEAIAALGEICMDKTAPPAARVSASSALLDRGFGKPPQALVGANEGPILIQEIRRVIVRADGDKKGE